MSNLDRFKESIMCSHRVFGLLIASVEADNKLDLIIKVINFGVFHLNEKIILSQVNKVQII